MKRILSALLTILLLASCLALFGCAEDGQDGKNGTMWYTGEGAPSVEDGTLGDLYLETDTAKIWKRMEDGWQVISSLKDEEEGARWFSGEGKPDGISANNGDLYLDTLSREIYIKETLEWKLYGNFSTDTIKQDWDEDGVLKILCIGNSFSDDSMEYVYQVADALGVEDIKLGNLYIGGCTLATHLSNVQGDKGAYAYRVNTSGSWSTTNNYKLSTAVQSENWDFISFQQASGSSGMVDTYDDLKALISLVKPMCPNASLVWHMTWAYQKGSTHSEFSKYDKDQLTMYNAIINAVNTKVDTNESISYVVPAGTAIQNTRTSYVGDNVTRDGYHLNDYGRYIGALSFVKALIGYDIENISYAPPSVSAGQIAVAIESVNNAVKSPYEITDSKITTEPEISTEELSLIDPELTKGAYYHSDYNKELTTTASNSSNFFATKIFTKDELPAGSVIEIADGWQYRPEGWVGTTNGGTRPGNVTTTKVLVSEAWWSTYTERGFNISRVDGSSLSSYSKEQIAEIFKIYVPQ